MKTIPRLASLLLPLAALLTITPAVLADETDPATDAPFKPKEYDLSKYSKNFEKKSPFEFDPPAPPPEETVNNFEGISLGGYCGNGNTMSVYLIAGKEKKRVTVYGDGSPLKKLDNSGFRIVSLNRGKSLSTTSVVLEKGGQTKEVKFEKETLMAKGGAGGQQQQMVIGPDGRPIQRAVVPRPGGGNPMPVQAYQPPAPFIPGQANGQNPNINGNNGGGMNPGGQNNFQAQQQAAINAQQQQQMNQLLNTPNVSQGNIINPQVNQGQVQGQGPGGGHGPGGGGQTPQRRRVVLPTQNQ